MKYTVLHSSSPLPLLHQAWQHPPAAGGDEPPTGWWQRSEWGKKQRALKIQRVTNHQRFLYRFRWWKVPEDPQRHLKTLKIKCERQQQPYVLKPHLFASNWLCIETRGFSCCEQSTRGVGYNSVHTVIHSVCVVVVDSVQTVWLHSCVFRTTVCPPARCGAPRPAGNSSRSSAPLSSPLPPRLRCFLWWCWWRESGGWSVKTLHLENKLICVGEQHFHQTVADACRRALLFFTVRWGVGVVCDTGERFWVGGF